MARYAHSGFKKTKNGKTHFRTTIYNSIPERDTDSYFITQEGDRCDNLAFRFYKDPNLWSFIARVNNLKTNNIPAGTKIRVPINSESAKGF